MKKLIFFLALVPGALHLHAQGCAPAINLNMPETSLTVVHQATNIVRGYANYSVGSGYDSTLKAGTVIELRPNTHIKSGSLFLAKITPCGKAGREEAPSEKPAEAVGLRAYPNPAENMLNLSLDNEIKSVTLATIEGRKILVHEPRNASFIQLDLNGYSPGIYILSVVTADGKTFVEKIVKK